MCAPSILFQQNTFLWPEIRLELGAQAFQAARGSARSLLGCGTEGLSSTCRGLVGTQQVPCIQWLLGKYWRDRIGCVPGEPGWVRLGAA